jgi:hypothetical protein
LHTALLVNCVYESPRTDSGRSFEDVFCDVLFALCVFVLCFVNPMRLVSLDCPYLIAPSVFSDVYFIHTEDTTTCVHFKVFILSKLIGEIVVRVCRDPPTSMRTTN